MTVEVVQDHTVLRITWAVPAALNALTPEMLNTAANAIEAVDHSVRVVVLTGHGRAFSSGAGVGEGLDVRDTMYAGKRLVQAILASRVPVVSGLNGLAAGLGMSIALASDFTIARRSAYLLAAFVNIGLSQDGGLSALLAAAVGRARATELIMLGERLSADDAAQAGLIYRAVDDDDFDTELREFVDRLAAGPTLAYAAVKRSLAATLGDLDRVFEAEIASQFSLFDTADAVEGTDAFRNKRKPRFIGE